MSEAQSKIRATHLYRAFDAAGKLLYVGISFSALARFNAHARRAEWFELAATLKIERFPTRLDAEIAERNAIVIEKPRFNVTHNVESRAPTPTNTIDEIVALLRCPRGHFARPCQPKFVYRHELKAVFGCDAAALIAAARRSAFPAPHLHGSNPAWLRDELIEYLRDAGSAGPERKAA